jgi:hypothetical protein
VQPSRKSGFAAKRADLAKHPQKYLLGQILSVSCVLEHSQTEAVHTLAMCFVQVLEGRRVTFLGPLDGFCFRKLAFRFVRECVPHAGFPSFR